MTPKSIFSNISKTFSYHDYKELVIQCAENKSTTGAEKLPERIEATKINAQRMKRLDKQIEVSPAVAEALKKNDSKWIWILIAESWCGDGAQNAPVIAKIAEASANIDLKVILRDDNPEIMDAFLTGGSRSIPKLICVNSETQEVIGNWGPRPHKIQQMVKEYKTQHPNASHDEFVKNLHLWYAKDKGESLQNDFAQLITRWIREATLPQ